MHFYLLAMRKTLRENVLGLHPFQNRQVLLAKLFLQQALQPRQKKVLRNPTSNTIAMFFVLTTLRYRTYQ